MATAAELQAGDRFRWGGSSWFRVQRIEWGTDVEDGGDLVQVYVVRPKRRSPAPDVAFAPGHPVEIADRPIRVTVSCDGPEEASIIAEALIDRRLAAGAQHWPVRSIYRSNGDVRRADETVLVIETLDTHLDAVQAAVVELHSYDAPSIRSEDADVGVAVRTWLMNETGADRGGLAG